MGRIISNANGTYTLRYWANGRQREETFSTKRLAEDRQAQLWRDKRAGEITFANKGKADVAFNDYCLTWIDRGQSRGERTKVIYRSTLKRVAPKLAGRTLAWVAEHRAEVEDVINGLKSEPAGTSYVRRARVIIVGCCNSAVTAGDLTGHKLRGLDIGRDIRVKPAVFSPASHGELEKLAGELGERYGLLVWLGRYAGLRIGESLGVNRADVMTGTDGGKVLVLQRQRLADGSLDALKAREAHEHRQIPVSPFLAARLAEASTDADGCYFPAEWRTSVMDQWRRARDRAGLPASFIPHALRHIFASDLLSKGARLDLVSKILGHKSVEITSKVYAHAMPSDFGTIRALLTAGDGQRQAV
jgi:integrase